MKKIFAVVYAAFIAAAFTGCSDSGNSSSGINNTQISESSAETDFENISESSLSNTTEESTTIPRITSIEQNTMTVIDDSKIEQIESLISSIGKVNKNTQINRLHDNEAAVYESPKSTSTTVKTDIIEKLRKEVQ